ncbi:Pyrimidine deoxynucleoside triphosphate (dYTP)pyrophospho hydrolase YfoO [Salmonella enterica subsp. enterica]|uniref:Pyrimidine deoxynucleoside triphosphate (DYTP)pyrophospho hydrolase YfoO n=1 Tax=Salmonella enterica I TaxID=59201 RepID=A0A447N785_SALET|nr:Pyrimidine deoxynucleoside triphosphate (dYTP)pyrophospho hydrolase YfoO [Salmonella enterica subsp. enterica]
MRQRTIVCPLIQNDGCYLLCKMADNCGVFPGQWGAVGRAGSSQANALKRRCVGRFGKNSANN